MIVLILFLWFITKSGSFRVERTQLSAIRLSLAMFISLMLLMTVATDCASLKASRIARSSNFGVVSALFLGASFVFPLTREEISVDSVFSRYAQTAIAWLLASAKTHKK